VSLSLSLLEESVSHPEVLTVLPSPTVAHLEHFVVHLLGTQEIGASQPLIEEGSEE
jgi:hypothetical protein